MWPIQLKPALSYTADLASMITKTPLHQIRHLALAILGIVALAGAATAQTIQWSTPGSTR